MCLTVGDYTGPTSVKIPSMGCSRSPITEHISARYCKSTAPDSKRLARVGSDRNGHYEREEEERRREKERTDSSSPQFSYIVRHALHTLQLPLSSFPRADQSSVLEHAIPHWRCAICSQSSARKTSRWTCKKESLQLGFHTLSIVLSSRGRSERLIKHDMYDRSIQNVWVRSRHWPPF
jgi:hypothetical protein